MARAATSLILSRPMHVLTRIAFCLLLAAVGAAAAEIGPEGAQSFAAQLRAWFSTMLGPDAPELPVQAQAEGDHYRVVVPLPGIRTQGEQPALTAAARQLPDGRWGIDNVRFPDKFAFATSPVLPGAGQGTATFVVGHQDGRAAIDPDLHLRSSFSLDAADIDVTTVGPQQTQEQRIDRYTAAGSLTPAEGGLLDVTISTEIDGWRTGAMGQGGIAAGSGLRSARATAHIGGLKPSQVGPAVAALVSLGAVLPAASRTRSESGGSAAHPHLTPAALAALHRLVEALPGIATEVRIDETLDGLQFELAGIGGATIDQVRFGFGGEAPAGMLRVWLDLGVDGLSIRGLPPERAALVPRMISLRPSVSGVPVKALNQLLTTLTRPAPAAPVPLDPAIKALFAQGSVTVGIEALHFAIGPAEFTGAGSILLLSPTEREGQARITATGYDALTDRARTDPHLSDVLPMLLLARALAKPDGDRLVWAIATDRTGKTTVNGVDVSGLSQLPNGNGTQGK